MKYWVFIGILVAVLLLLDIGQRIHMINLGYEIEQLSRTHRDIERRHKELLIERETLSSLDRIEQIAVKQLGMKQPDYGQFINVYPSGTNERLPEDLKTLKVVRN